MMAGVHALGTLLMSFLQHVCVRELHEILRTCMKEIRMILQFFNSDCVILFCGTIAVALFYF
jgi:hypothetical protein